MKKNHTIALVIAVIVVQVYICFVQPIQLLLMPLNETELADRKVYAEGNESFTYSDMSTGSIRYRKEHWDNLRVFYAGIDGFFLSIPFGLIPAIIAKRKGLCSKKKGRCTFMVWWVYGTTLFIVALLHSLISKADVQAIEMIKQDAERKEQRRKESAERAVQSAEQWQKQKAEYAEQRRKLLQTANSETGGKTVPVVAIGGNGWEFLTNRKLIAGLGAEGLYLWDLEALKSYTVHCETITDINVGGPGTVRSGGGAMGGGFGLDGFLVGALAATVLNALTSHKTTKTLVHVKCENSEIFLLISTMEPDETRIYLSPLFVSLESKPNASNPAGGKSGIAEEIQKLAKLLADGHITSEEFAKFKSNLL